MNVTDALDRIRVIHEHLAKSEVYRGYHPVAVGLAGAGGLLAAILQPWVVPSGEPAAFLHYWLAAGVCCALVGMSVTILRFLRGEDAVARRRTLTVVGQFFPCLIAGAIVTAALARPEFEGVGVPLLPGLWAVLFGLGVVAERPYLPPATGWVAAWYLACGLVLLWLPAEAALSGWAIGLPFGAGQLGMAHVLRSARRGAEEGRS